MDSYKVRYSVSFDLNIYTFDKVAIESGHPLLTDFHPFQIYRQHTLMITPSSQVPASNPP